MDALLILGGLLMIVTGLVLLVTLAFGTSLLWGLGSLLPPLTLVYVVRYWRRARKALALMGMGCIPLVVGLVQLASHDTERLQAIFSLEWLKTPPAPVPELDIQLYGELRGEPFRPVEAELIDGVLSLREQGDFFARREVSLSLPGYQGGPLRLDVLPQDGGSLPEVEVAWLEGERELPEARRINRGYTLHLDLQPVTPNRMLGDFHLVMPPALKTALSGRIELFTDQLRYVNGEVDRRHDSMDTLAWVARDYLQRREQTRDVRLMPLPVQRLSDAELNLPVEAMVAGKPLALTLQLRKHSLKGWQVTGDRFQRLEQPVAPVAQAQPEVAPEPAVQDRRQGFSLARLLREPERYRQLSVRIETTAGSVAEGKFTGLSPTGRLLLQRQLKAVGDVSYRFKPEDVVSIELLEP